MIKIRQMKVTLFVHSVSFLSFPFSFLSAQPSASVSMPPGYSWSSSEPMDATISRSLLDRKRLQGDKRLSISSLQSSSVATSTTIGLSPTPPSPNPISPRACLDHENFHSLATTSTPHSRTLTSGRGSVDEERGVVVADRDDTSSNNSGSMEDRFQGGLFRSRSNHVVSRYQHLSSETLSASLGSSTHEQLHYSTPSSSTPTDQPWRKRESPQQGSTSVLSDQFQGSMISGGEKEEVSDMGGGLTEIESEENSSFVIVPPSLSKDFSPASSTTVQEQKMDKYFLGQKLAQNRLEQEPDTSEWVSEQNKLCRYDNLCQQSVKQSVKQQKMELRKSLSDPQTDPQTSTLSASNDTNHTLFYDEDDWDKVGHIDNPYSNDGGGDGGTQMASGLQQREEQLTADSFVLNREESSLDQLNRKRSGPLVSPEELLTRRVLAETKEHNFPPSPPSTSLSVVFTASGFSRPSPNREDVSEVSQEDHMIPDTTSNNVSSQSPLLTDGDRENRNKSPVMLVEQTASIQVLNSKIPVAELNKLVSPSSQPHLTGIPSSWATNNYMGHDPSSTTHGSLPPCTTSALPPSTLSPSPGHMISPQGSVFQRPHGYLLKQAGLSSTHRVGGSEEGRETVPVSTLVTEGAQSPTGHTHPGMGGTGRDPQFLEDFIDGF